MTLQKAALSHAQSPRWPLARLETPDSGPQITSVRVLRRETVFTTSRGAMHDPKDRRTLRGLDSLGSLFGADSPAGNSAVYAPGLVRPGMLASNPLPGTTGMHQARENLDRRQSPAIPES